MNKKILVSGLLALVITAGNAQTDHAVATEKAQLSGYVYNEHGCYGFTAPHGWILDNKILADQGVGMAFYPADSDWNSARMAIYTKIYSSAKNKGYQEIVAEEIASVRESYKKEGIEVSAKKREAFSGKDGSNGELWHLDYGNGLEEQVVYFPLGAGTVGVFVLQMDGKTDKAKAIAALRTLASSYHLRQECKPCQDETSCTNEQAVPRINDDLL